MRSAGPWRVAAAVLVPAMATAGAACTLTTSLVGYAGSPEEAGAVDAGEAGPPPADGGPPPADGGKSITSCDALKRASPGTPDGVQLIDPDGDGPAPAFPAFCDMTSDDGGWMLVTAAMLGDETKVEATVVRGTGDHGGLVMRVFVNSPGCASTKPRTRHRIFLADRLPWKRVRLAQTFAGSAACWHIFGGLEDAASSLDSNLVPFDPAQDTVRKAVKMGGSAGDAFDGRPTRCDNEATNFWRDDVGERSATVILRRRDPGLPSGLSTGGDCGSSGPGETSETWWEYRDIYVK